MGGLFVNYYNQFAEPMQVYIRVRSSLPVEYR